MKKSVLTVFALVGFVLSGLMLDSCMPKSPKETEDVYLHVNFSNTMGINWIFLKELNVHDLRTVDSFDVRKSGRHTFKLSINEPGFFIIQTKPYSFITLLLEPGEKVDLFADGKKMKKDYQVKGSPGSVILKDYFFHTEMNMKKIDSLREVFSTIKDSQNFAEKRQELDSAYYRINSEQKDYVLNLVKRNNKSIASVFLVNQRFGPDQILTEKTDFPLFAELDSCLMAIYPENKHVLDHHQRVTEAKRRQLELKLAEERLKPGNPAPEVKLYDQDNKGITTSSLYGKTVLLYFWSASTAKARQDHNLMLPFYKRSREKGFEIVSVSLDENRDMWLAAVKVDKIPWITVSETAGMKSPIARLFALHEGLPYYYVIDKEWNMAGEGKSFTEVKSLLTYLLNR